METIQKEWMPRPVELYPEFRTVYGAVSLFYFVSGKRTLQKAINCVISPEIEENEYGEPVVKNVVPKLISVYAYETRVKGEVLHGLYHRSYRPQIDEADADISRNLVVVECHDV